jgi:glutathione S-transferase
VALAAECDILFAFEDGFLAGAVAPKRGAPCDGGCRETERSHRRSPLPRSDRERECMHLIIGNKNYSSWSFRPWFAMKVAGLHFEETVIPLSAPDFKERVSKLAATTKVPVLIDGDVIVWESLAIIEYVAETRPDARLWPADRAARAHARAIANEMHAGFAALRRHCPMNMARPVRRLRALTDDVLADIRRIDAIWQMCLARFGGGGPFLFEQFSAADAMYAPVVSRFRTYAIEVSSVSHAYMEAIMTLPAWTEWTHAALLESWVLPENELDWPVVLREEEAGVVQ